MNSLALPHNSKPERKRPNRSEAKIVGNARQIMHLMHLDALNPKTTPAIRATIARSYALLGDAIRVWRGIPSPGQLRPDLDPLQLAKALKRQRSRSGVTDIGSTSHFEAPNEEAPASPEKETTKQEQKTETPPTDGKTSKESLSEGGAVTTGPGGGGK